MTAERLGDRVSLAQPEQPRIDEHADHLRPERLRQKGRTDGRVDPAGKPAYHPFSVAPTRRPMSSRDRSMKASIVHVLGFAQIRSRKFPRISEPYGVCETSGWNCKPKIGSFRCRRPRSGRSASPPAERKSLPAFWI